MTPAEWEATLDQIKRCVVVRVHLADLPALLGLVGVGGWRRVRLPGIPDGAIVRDVRMEFGGAFLVKYEHPSFDRAAEGAPYPIIEAAPVVEEYRE